MDGQYNIARVSEKETWQRNQYNKNWGNYTVLQFRKGEPTYFIASYISLFYLAAAFLFLAYMIVSSLLHQSGVKLLSPLSIIRILSFLLSLVGWVMLLRTNPGVRSISAPIINQTQLGAIRNFCVLCKCMQVEGVKHCMECNVCLCASIVHSNLLKCCITRTNIAPFITLWCGLAIHALICLLQ